MKVDLISKEELEEILGRSRLVTDVHNSGWRVEVHSTEDQLRVLITGTGGDFECAQLASAFHSAYRHLFDPDHEVRFCRVPIGYRRQSDSPEPDPPQLWTRVLEKSCSAIALTIAYVKSLAL